MTRRKASEAPPITGADVRAAALSCFAERGYHGTTMKDIAGTLGVQAPSLYNHVASKQGLLQDVVFDAMTRVEAAVYPVLDDRAADPATRLRAAVVAHVVHHARYLVETHVGQSEIAALEPRARAEFVRRRRTYAHRFRELVREGVVAGIFATPRPDLTARAIVEMGISVSNWFHEGGEFSREQVAEHYAALAMRMVVADVPELLAHPG